ncbi:MAG TPA: hypothetical protein VFM01_16470 [Nakamurella sp.]|nr:hypothetical protein [Nakamurella sp.]
MTPTPPRWVRRAAPLLRLPALLDRRGLRWALRLCSPYPILIVVHRGRRSGRRYRTPVELLSGSPDAQMYVLPLAGRRSDWYRNVAAGGLRCGSCRGRRGAMRWRVAEVGEARRALDDYRRRHRWYTRALLAVVARVNGLAGTPSNAEIAAAMPIVVFEFAAISSAGAGIA